MTVHQRRMVRTTSMLIASPPSASNGHARLPGQLLELDVGRNERGCTSRLRHRVRRRVGIDSPRNPGYHGVVVAHLKIRRGQHLADDPRPPRGRYEDAVTV